MEFAIWGTKNGKEDIIRINGEEVQDSIAKAKKIKSILENRGEFQKVRIQEINTNKWDIKASFIGGIKRNR